MSETVVAAGRFSDVIRLHQIPIASDRSIVVDGVRPALRVEPASIEELQTCLSEASRSSSRLIATGAGSRLHLGNAPTGLESIVSLRRMDKVLALESADMTVTVEGGVGIDNLQQALSAHGQFLPLDSPGDGGSVGGLLASNVSGPLRHSYGTVRDWLLGTRVVHADGTSTKSGGRVVKNVSGYDMHKLYIGSLGTLAVIAEATLKIAPLPQVDDTIAVLCPSASSATSIITASHERGLGLIAAELLSPTAANAVLGRLSWCALLRVGSGLAAAVRTLREIDEYATLAEGERLEPGVDTWSRWREALAPTVLSLRLSVMPSRIADAAEAIDRRFAGDAVAISCTAAVGLLRVNLKPSDDERAMTIIEQVREIAQRRGGFAVVDAAAVAVKRKIDVFGAERSDIEIMQRLKQEFDPKRILAPGRFVGRI